MNDLEYQPQNKLQIMIMIWFGLFVILILFDYKNYINKENSKYNPPSHIIVYSNSF